MIIRALHLAPLLFATSAAAGGPADRPAPRVPAIDNALEIVVAISNAHSTGDIGDGMNAGDLIGSAGQLDLEVGYRVSPHLTLGFYSNAQALAEGPADGRSVHTGAAGIEADFHFRPTDPLDPWMSVGTGVRAYLLGDEGAYTVGVGAELLRLQLGADFRLDENISIGPVIGASASLYGAEKRPMEEFHELSGKGINWTFTAGVAGRFNAFGTRR